MRSYFSFLYKGLGGSLMVLYCWGCNFDGPSWDVDILAPGIETVLTAENLIGANNLTSDGAGQLFLDMEQEVYNFSLDTISSIGDISVLQVVTFPFSASIAPGTVLPAQNYTLALNLNGPSVKYARVKDGVLQLSIKSLVKSKIFFTYEIPKAKKNGISFTFTDFIPASNGTDTITYTKAFNVAGYDLDMTGLNGTEFNKLNFTVIPTIDPDNGGPCEIVANEFLFSVDNKLINLSPIYLRGYFGQLDVLSGSDTVEIDFLKKFISGSVDLPGITMDMQLENYLGANIRIKPSFFRAINSKTGNSVNLMHPSIGNSVNINRATETGGYPPVNPAIETLHFDPMNSNLKQFMEVLPDQIGFTFEAALNPYGNVSGHNDFLYTLYPPKVKLKIQAPLKAAIDNLVFVDTILYDLTDANELDNFLSGKFKLIADNSFPFELGINLYLLDAQGNITDTLFTQDVVQSGFDIPGGNVQSILEFPVSTPKIVHLKTAERMLLKARILTKPENQQLHLKNYQRLKIKLIADIKYLINL